ncbi:sporulation integral membrane protein YtvI [Paenibacillus sp. LMG 31456]|uniref:Sporulation integral membrane protein YtvI n=1 Tax=Paenibacillus foliorum TaxID=2654974 RepID=A0A972GY73_9BACL|nr:sporulation integral membrane protein YtvI [Paenibacillus foliorum]NOU95972.1 sporulation integral membrane protein YtvI [Paenibacillus foliorum]
MPLKTIVFIVVSILLLYGLFTVGFPFLLALLIAILLEPVVLWMMRKFRFNRIVSAAITCSLLIAGILSAFFLIGLKIYLEFVEFVGKIPMILSEVDLFVKEALTGQGIIYRSFPVEWAGYIQSGLIMGVDSLTDGLNRIISSASGMILNVAKTLPNLLIFSIVFILALFLISIGLEQIKRTFLHWFSDGTRGKMESVLSHLREAIIGFLKAQILISVLTYIVTLIGLLFLGTGYPLAIALIIIIVDLLPILGTGSVLVPWAAYSFIQGDLNLAIGLLILFLVITVFRRIVEPKIVGDAVGISALATLASLYIGFKLIGVAGLFLGPIVIIFFQALKKAGIAKIKIDL